MTAAGVVTGTLDTSALTIQPLIRVDVVSLTAGAKARIAIEDTANASAFSDALPVAVFDVVGQVNAPVELAIRTEDCPTLRYGATNNKLRANVLILSGSSPSLTVHAYTQ